MVAVSPTIKLGSLRLGTFDVNTTVTFDTEKILFTLLESISLVGGIFFDASLILQDMSDQK